MGSLFSRPSVPAVKPVRVVTTTPTVTTATSSSSLSSSNTNTSSETASSAAGAGTSSSQNTSATTNTDTNENAVTAAGDSSLLDSGRGRVSTILTGYRGILSDVIPVTSVRKSLLGE